MKNPGIIVQLSDGRHCIVYNDQPLRVPNGCIILHLVDESQNKLMNDNGHPKVIIRTEMDYAREMQSAQLIGYVD